MIPGFQLLSFFIDATDRNETRTNEKTRTRAEPNDIIKVMNSNGLFSKAAVTRKLDDAFLFK